MEMPGNQGYLLGLGAGIYFGLVLGFEAWVKGLGFATSLRAYVQSLF